MESQYNEYLQQLIDQFALYEYVAAVIGFLIVGAFFLLIAHIVDLLRQISLNTKSPDDIHLEHKHADFVSMVVMVVSYALVVMGAVMLLRSL